MGKGEGGLRHSRCYCCYFLAHTDTEDFWHGRKKLGVMCKVLGVEGKG